MDEIKIHGGVSLRGDVSVSGAKNAALPLLAASLLAEGQTVLRGVPQLKDIDSMIELMQSLGCAVQWSEEDSHAVICEVRDESVVEASYDLVRKMRASICVLGPLLAKRGHARVSFPGGCVIGPRPVDLHLKGLRALGAHITVDEGYIEAKAEKLQGATIDLQGPCGSSVLATANTMMAAVLAQGTTVIQHAACEPEVQDLGYFLKTMGAQIEGLGTSTITIKGVKRLQGASYKIIPDRIEAGTLLLAGVITRGRVRVKHCVPAHVQALLDMFDRMGVSYTKEETAVVVDGTKPFKAVTVDTIPYPGFPTDLQAQLMATLCLAEGRSQLTENIYPERFLHVSELNRMGANIEYCKGSAIVQGPTPLKGTRVMSSDLRASAALVLAGLAAEGETHVGRIYHLDRGYEQMEHKLTLLGARIERVHEAVHA